jgi:type I restriction enzyme S subunit
VSWATEPLGNLCDILDSKRKPITKRDREPGPYPYYGATGVLDYVRDFIFDEKLVLIGEDGAKWSAGDNTAFSAEGFYWVNNHAHVIRPNRNKLLDEWLIYFLNASDLTPFITGLTVPKLNQAKLREIDIPLPSLPQQRRIVSILDEAFAGLEAMRANAEKNLQNARELFGVSFESLTREHNNKYKKVTVEEMASKKKNAIRTGPFGSQLLHSEFVDDGIAVLGIDNAVSNEFRWAKRRCITEEKYEALKRYRVFPGDVLITIMGTCGRCAIVPEDIRLAINTKHLCCITLDQEKCTPEYLHAYFLHHPASQSFLQRRVKGSIMDGLNMGIIKELPIVLPPLDEQRRLIVTLAELRRESTRLQGVYTQKLAAIDELKQSILQKAFAGELTAAEAVAA